MRKDIFYSGDIVELLNLSKGDVNDLISIGWKEDDLKRVIGMRYPLLVSAMDYGKGPQFSYMLLGWYSVRSDVKHINVGQFMLYHRPKENVEKYEHYLKTGEYMYNDVIIKL